MPNKGRTRLSQHSGLARHSFAHLAREDKDSRSAAWASSSEYNVAGLTVSDCAEVRSSAVLACHSVILRDACTSVHRIRAAQRWHKNRRKCE